MPTPSEPLLQRLRDLIEQRALELSSLSARAEMDSERLERVLAAAEPMTVDELIALTQALELRPEDFGLLPDDPVPLYDEPVVAPLPHLHEVDEPLVDDLGIEDVVDPYGNHAQQLFEVGFSLGCDFFFHATTNELEGSGIPLDVLERYRDNILPIKLDAAYHHYNEPRYEADGVWLKLSFDAVYDCFFPWSSVQRLIFSPEPMDPSAEPPAEDDPPKAPFLRLVE